MLFWLTRTVTVRTLIEAPAKEAVQLYSESDGFAAYVEQTSGDTADTITQAGTHPRQYGGVPPVPDLVLDAAGEEIDE